MSLFRRLSRIAVCFAIASFAAFCPAKEGDLAAQFQRPPASARPWVYWYFMDGNLTREGITADLEAMAKAGIGGAIFLEVDLGIPRGPVRFMSKPWQELLRHAAREAERLGIELALAAGPGWCGTGGPWVKPEQSMQHLVASETMVAGPKRFDTVLPRPKPREPFFGRGTLTPELKKAWESYYRDVAVLAFPTPQGKGRIADIDEKALFRRAPFSSAPKVKPFLPAPAEHPASPSDGCIAVDRIVDLTSKLAADGRLAWDVPAGEWTILRFGRTTTGQVTRPAPMPGLGFECDKLSAAATDAHLDAFVETLLKVIGPTTRPGCGLTTLHFDSWEMSAQNWSEKFREEFAKRRGYDPLPYLPATTGLIVGSREASERFLWDLRQTAQELMVANHIERLKECAHRHGLRLSMEPYDMNPAADLTLGGPADVPMCEFWLRGHGFDTAYSCFEAVSIAHTRGRPIVGAESFTAGDGEAWHFYPGAMKAQADWALCTGVNRIAFHRYQHQPWLDRRPGMTMGPYGVHWERTQTWWDMAPAFHTYLARCQHLLRQGLPVADILYLAPEGAPHVFRPPTSATRGDPPDRRGHNFDGCSPETLVERAAVKDGRIVFPDGMSYRVLVLSHLDTMTPALLGKIKSLVEAGATVIGRRPSKSPSLSDYPKCDEAVQRMAEELWGQGRVVQPPIPKDAGTPGCLYPDYSFTAAVLAKMAVPEDFHADRPLRYLHRRVGATDIYFVANPESATVEADCTFRVAGKTPEIWDPLTGETREASAFAQHGPCTTVPLRFEPTGSLFIVFRRPTDKPRSEGENFAAFETVQDLRGPWNVAFDPKGGGPASVVFDDLVDWTKRPESDIRHYSGKAVYRKTFALPEIAKGRRLFLCLGDVKDLAEVRLNGKPLGALWCPPWRIEMTDAVQPGENRLEVTVANEWVNRLIGDAALPPEKRIAWTTWNPYKADSPLQASGLLGPVAIEGQQAPAASLETRFRELPIESRRQIGPLFWLHGDEGRERLEMYVARVAEGGNGCFTVESRPHRDWLGPTWFRDLGVCLEAAKKHNLKMWIFDEKWWPSQGVAGKVPPRYAVKQLQAAAADVQGPQRYKADGYGGERYVTTVAGRLTSDGKIDGDSLVDLAPSIHDGRLDWQVPAGKWRVMKFTHAQGQPLAQNGQLSVDGASKDCVDWYLQTVYQPHYDHFGAEFGKTIVGFFYDEPETRGDWGTELNAVLAERGVDWKKAYVAYKFQLAGEEQTAARFQYLDAFADAWGRTMYGGIAHWCHRRGVKSIGHFMEHGGLYHRRDFCAGDMMRLQRYSDMGAIDAVFKQFAMGKRIAADPPTWQTPKLASSVSHVFGKADDMAMVEIFGARGQDLTYPEMKWWADHMQVSGVNFLIPHSFNPRSPYDDDCPPYFYNGGFEPRWPLYRVFADYSSRLSLMLTGGRHVCPVAILFNGNLGQVGKMVTPEEITTALQNAQIDCDWLPMDVFEKDAKLDVQTIKLHNERYRVLIVPPVEAIPYATLAKVKEFFDKGGIVIGYGFLPSKSATIGRSRAEIRALCCSIWGDMVNDLETEQAKRHLWLSSRNESGGRAEYRTSLDDAVKCCPDAGDVRPLMADSWLHLLHRQKAGRNVFLIANQNHQGKAGLYSFRVRTKEIPECWDPMRNEIVTPQFWRNDAATITVQMTLEPLETMLLVFQPQKIARPMRIEPDTKPIREAIVLTREANPPASPPTPDRTRKPLTLSPVQAADPFRAKVVIPPDVDLTKCRVYLQMDDLPDNAAAVTVNGQRAGGVIGRPTRLDIAARLKPGENTILIEPLAPKAARLVFYAR